MTLPFRARTLFRTRPARPDHLLVDGADGAVRVHLRWNDRARRYTLRVPAATAEPVLTIPARGTLPVARDFLDRTRPWLDQRLAALPARAALADGTVLPLRGEPHRIAHRPDGNGAVRLEAAADGTPLIVVPGALPHLDRRVRDFLKREAKRDLAAAAARHAAALGVRVASITLRDPRSRWGSCSSGGGLSFSWRLIMAPPMVLDYLAAHEVAHLREMNHSPRFWLLVEDLCPATARAEAWLKRHGAGLHAVAPAPR